jgi:hypothetical protein
MVVHEGMYGSFSLPLANWNLAGMGLIDQKIAHRDLVKKNKLKLAELQYNNFYKSITGLSQQKKSYIKYA